MRTPGEALYAQREQLARHLPRWRRLQDLVARPEDLGPPQWLQLAAFALDYQPDLIIELGRGYGNSTTLFMEVANQLGDCRVISLCNSHAWRKKTRRKLARECDGPWFSAGEIREVDILRTALDLEGSERCLVFWDAHGFGVAEWVLGHLLPRLSLGSQRIVLHDMADRRFCAVDRSYQTTPLWKGGNADLPGMHLGNIFSRVGQAISVLDFTTRNELRLQSADESLHGLDSVQTAELQATFGDWFHQTAQWYWFSLEDMPVEPVFPEYAFPREPGRIARLADFVGQKCVGATRRLRRLTRAIAPQGAARAGLPSQVISARICVAGSRSAPPRLQAPISTFPAKS
jgi:hypothetical protein